MAQIACEVSAEHVEGDHTLFIGKVTDIHIDEDAEPLVFYSGSYRSLTSLAACHRLSERKETVWKRFI